MYFPRDPISLIVTRGVNKVYLSKLQTVIHNSYASQEKFGEAVIIQIIQSAQAVKPVKTFFKYLQDEIEGSYHLNF